MIDIYYFKTEERLASKYTDLIEGLIGDVEKKKSYRYRRWQDKQAYLLGKFLVAKLLIKNGYNPGLLRELGYTEFNRPQIKNEKFDFNISHAGQIVICAFSAKQVVGIDIEKIQSIDLNDFDYILNKSDKEKIENSENEYVSFFSIWSAKEAILKAEGCGLVDDLYKLEVNDHKGFFNGTFYYLKDLKIDPSYSSCIASIAPVNDINLQELSIENCFESFR